MAGIDDLIERYEAGNARDLGVYAGFLERSLQTLQGYREEYNKGQISRSKRLAELSKEIGEISIAKEEDLLAMRQNLNAIIEQENNEYLKKYGSVLNNKAMDVLQNAANVKVPTFASIMLGYEAARQSAADREEKHLNRQMEVYKRVEEIARQKAELEARRAQNERAVQIAELQAESEAAKVELDTRVQEYNAATNLASKVVDVALNQNARTLDVLAKNNEQQMGFEAARIVREQMQVNQQQADEHTQMINDLNDLLKNVSDRIDNERLKEIGAEINNKYGTDKIKALKESHIKDGDPLRNIIDMYVLPANTAGTNVASNANAAGNAAGTNAGNASNAGTNNIKKLTPVEELNRNAIDENNAKYMPTQEEIETYKGIYPVNDPNAEYSVIDRPFEIFRQLGRDVSNINNRKTFKREYKKKENRDAPESLIDLFDRLDNDSTNREFSRFLPDFIEDKENSIIAGNYWDDYKRIYKEVHGSDPDSYHFRMFNSLSDRDKIYAIDNLPNQYTDENITIGERERERIRKETDKIRKEFLKRSGSKQPEQQQSEQPNAQINQSNQEQYLADNSPDIEAIILPDGGYYA